MQKKTIRPYYSTSAIATPNMSKLLFTLLAVTLFNLTQAGRTVLVECPAGQVEGIQGRSVPSQKIFFSFHGIPFAKPPTGARR